MKLKLLSLLVFSIPFMANAQRQGQALIDSLLKELPDQKEDTAKALTLCRLSTTYYSINTTEGLKYGRQALLIAGRLGWKKGVAKSYNSIGTNFFAKGDYPTAIAYFDSGISVAEQLADKRDMDNSLINKGTIYNMQGNFPVAMGCYEKAIKISEEIGDSLNMANCAQNIANIYIKMHNGEKALTYLRQALPVFQSLHLMKSLSTNMGGQGDAYSDLHKDSVALLYYRKSLQISETLQDSDGMVTDLNSLAIFYQKKKDLKNALIEYSRGLPIAMRLGNSYLTAVFENNLAVLCLDKTESSHEQGFRTAQLKTAKGYLSDAIRLNKENGTIDLLQENYNALSRLYELEGNYKSALGAYQQYTKYKDSIFNTDNKQTIQQLEDQREIDLKDKQIRINDLEISNQKSQRRLYISGLIMLFVVGGLLFIQNRLRKTANIKLQQLNTQLDEANKTKARFLSILSHDLRSPVASLINFLNFQKEFPDLLDTEKIARHQHKITTTAENLLFTMEDLLLWSKRQMKAVTTQKKRLAVGDLFNELLNLYPNADLFQMSFQNPENLIINSDENCLKTILRNLTTNAIKAVKNRPDGLILWRAWQEDGKKYLSVSDNGPGISDDQQRILFNDEAGIGNGLGLHLIRDFAAAIDCRITVSSQAGSGATFTLTL